MSDTPPPIPPPGVPPGLQPAPTPHRNPSEQATEAWRAEVAGRRVGPGPARTHRGPLILGLGGGSLGMLVLAAITSFQLPVCSCMWFGTLAAAVAAWVMASGDLRGMDAGVVDPSGRAQTRAGRACAIVSVVLHALALIALAVLIIVMGAAAVAFFVGAGGGPAPVR